MGEGERVLANLHFLEILLSFHREREIVSAIWELERVCKVGSFGSEEFKGKNLLFYSPFFLRNGFI